MTKFEENLLQKYRNSLSEANMGLWEWDFVLKKIFFDQGFARLYEFEESSGIIEPEDWYRTIHPKDLEKARYYVQEARANDTNIDALFRIVTKSKKIKYIRTHALKVKDSNGATTSYVGLNWEVTAEITLKKDLKHAKVFLEKIVDAVPDPIFVKDMDHRWIFCNREFEKMLGRSRDEILGKSDYDFFPKELADSYWKRDNEVLIHGKSNEVEEKGISADGSTLEILTKKSPFQLEENQRLLVGVIRDITEKNKADSQFRLMISLIDSSGDLFGFANRKGTPLYVNKTGMETYGVQVGGKPVYEYLSEKDQKIFRGLAVKALKNNESWEGEVTHINPQNGEEIPVWLKCFSIRVSEGPDGIFYACTGSDLRKIKEIQNSLIAQSKMASLGEMAAEIAHEINNPLAIIQGKSQLLQDHISRGEVDIEKLRKGFEQIETNSGRIKRIIDSSRAFARKSEKDPFEFVSLLKIVEEAYELSRERFSIKQLTLEFKVLNEITYSDTVLARSSEIIQVLVNLLNNAFDAIRNQSAGRVTLCLMRAKGNYQIEVTDTGEKIPHEIAEKMMEPFFTTKPTGEGTGLGLSLSKQIAENHAAILYYDPKAPRTRFVFEIKSAYKKI